MCGPKKRKKSEKVTAGSVSGRKTKPGETGKDRNEGNRPELTHAERGEHQPQGVLLRQKHSLKSLLFMSSAIECFPWQHSGWCNKQQIFLVKRKPASEFYQIFVNYHPQKNRFLF